MNRATLIGNLTRDPELKTTGGGFSVCTFSIAVPRKFRDSNGEKITDFFSIVTWRGLADNCAQSLHKGSKAFVGGSLQNRSYDAKDGSKRYVTEIIADEVEFLDRKEDGAQGRTERQAYGTETSDSGLPF